jgi:Flp pilus assembly pilin Flp
MPHTTKPTIDLRDARGQTMAEYAVILALLVTVVMFTLGIFGDTVARLWSTFNSSFGG